MKDDVCVIGALVSLTTAVEASAYFVAKQSVFDGCHLYGRGRAPLLYLKVGVKNRLHSTESKSNA